jgi:hypothetical protein
MTCGAGAVQLHVTMDENAVKYNWYESEMDLNPIFDGTAFQTSELTTSTTYYVAAVNKAGCEGPRTEVLAEVITVDPATITMLSGNRLSSNASTGNQWYFNDVAIPGATQRTLVATHSGTYRVDILTNGCLSSASIEHTMIRASDQEPVVAYPNPFNGRTGLRIEILGEQISSVQLIGTTGAVTTDIPMMVAAPGVWVNTNTLSNVPNGLYFVRTVSDNKTVTIKVLKSE